MPPSASFPSMRYGPSRRPSREGGAAVASTAWEKPARKLLAPASAATSAAASAARSGSSWRSSDRASRCPLGVFSMTSSKIDRSRRKRSRSAIERSWSRAAETAVKPALGQAPVPPHRGVGEAQHRGDLVVLEAAEDPQLDDPGQPLVRLLELPQGIAEGHQMGVPFHHHVRDLGEPHLAELAAMLRILAPPCAVDQDPPHHAGGDGEEMGPIPPVDGLEIAEPQESLVHQIAGLQSRPLPLAVEIAPRQAAQLAVHQRCELLQRAFIASPPILEKLGDPAHRRSTARRRLQGFTLPNAHQS